MAVRPGYKQTEVGVIPEDWEFTTVGQLVHDGVLEKPMDGNHGNLHPKGGDFVDFGIPFVMANNVRDGRLDLSHCAFIQKKQADSLQKGFSQPGDVLLTHKATIGNTAVVEEIPFDYIMLTPQVTYYRVADRAKLNNLYLRHFFDSASFQKTILSMSGGGTRAYIGITAQLQLPVVVPPLREQQAIAEALSDVDGLISALDALIAKKRALKQGAMQELLTGQRRLPGFSGSWEVKTLGEIGDKFLNGGTPSTEKTEYWQGEIPWITGADVVNQTVSEVRRFITEEAVKNSATNLVENGNLLIVTRTGVGKIAIAPFDLAISQDLTGVYVKKDQATPEYLYRFFDYNSDKLKILNQGTSIAGITRETLTTMKVSLPSLPEQTAIVQILADMDAELAALVQKRAKTVALKQGMMQSLLTGQVRLV